MDFLFILLILIVATLIYMSFEASFVQIAKVKMTKNKDCLKVLQLSDIHIGLLRVSPKKVREAIEQENPDMIILTGDYIEKESDIPKFIRFIKEINIIDKTFLCLGNHDYRAFINNKNGLSKFINSIESLGITVLHNDSICYEKNNRKYNIIGISDLRCGSYDIEKALSSIDADAFMNISFSHNPDIALEIPRGKVDYLLCGHFHGGQIWAPFRLEYKVLRKDKLCKKGICRGLHKVNGINLYINRGLGNVLFPFRLFSRPEITILYLP